MNALRQFEHLATAITVTQVMSVLSREHLTGEVEMRDVATLMELMTKTISSARYPPSQRTEKRRGKYAFVVQVCCRVP